MLSNAYFLAKFRFDTAENEPAKNLQNFANFPNFANFEVKDLIQHIRKAVRDDAACAVGITQRAFIDEDHLAYGEAPGSPFARVHGGVALICTLMLGDRYDWSETFNFEKRFGKFSEHKSPRASRIFTSLSGHTTLLPISKTVYNFL